MTDATFDPMAEWEKLKSEHPELAGRLETEIKHHVRQTEQGFDGAPGDTKQQAAFTSALAAIYDGADIFFGFPGPVDLLIKQVLIPALPTLIDGAVAWFHEQGIFQKARN